MGEVYTYSYVGTRGLQSRPTRGYLSVMETKGVVDMGALTMAQVAWAATHDWFVRDLKNGCIEVVDRSFNRATGQIESHPAIFADFRKLREWAGY